MATKKFKTEVTDLLQLIIHSLYSNREIFLRELVSNASDALDKLKYLSMTEGDLKGYEFDPRIDITFTEGDKRTLTIKDNGIGMNEDDLNNNLGTIASSGTKKFLQSLSEEDKKDNNLIGQFGVGFYAAFMVADKIEVISRKAGEEAAWKWTSKGKNSYDIEPAERDQQGTTIILHLNEDSQNYANRYELEQLIKKYSDHIAYPIYMEYDKENYDYEKKDAEGNPTKTVEHRIDKMNSSSALWSRNKSSIKDEEYKELYKNNYYDSEDPLFYVPAKAPADMNYADYTPGVKLYVKRVYITDDDKTLLPPYLRFVRGVIDSEDLPLNVSREILQENRVMTAIRNGSVKKLLSEFKKISENNPEQYAEFISQYNRPLKEGLYGDYANHDALLGLVRYHSSSRDGWVSLKEYKDAMKEDQKAIYYLTGGKEDVLKASPLLEAYRAKGIEVLILDDDIDEIVIQAVPEFDGTPLKAINKSGALDDLKTEDDEKIKEEKKGLAEKIKTALGDRVKDVIISTRLVDTPACVVMDENDPSVQMQQILRQMGNGAEMPEVKPMLEINAESALIKKIEALTDEEELKLYTSVLLDQAFLQEGIMPKDTAAFAKALTKLLEK